MKTGVGVCTLCAVLALSACELGDGDDDRETISIDSLRAREGGVAATATPSIGAGRSPARSPGADQERPDPDLPADVPSQPVTDGGLAATDAALPTVPFGNSPPDGGLGVGFMAE